MDARHDVAYVIEEQITIEEVRVAAATPKRNER
jgi:hypothetical protein